MNSALQLTEILAGAIEATTDATERASLAAAIKSLAESQKLDAEALKLKEDTANIQRLSKADARRFSLTVLAPSLSAIAVVLAVGVQVFQVNRNAEIQRELNEATTLRETLKLAASEKSSEAFAGSLFLTSMLSSVNYGSTVRSISLNILTHTAEAKGFQALFDAIQLTTTSETIRDLARLSEQLTGGLSEIRTYISDKASGKQTLMILPRGIVPQQIESNLNEEVKIVGEGILAIVRKTPQSFVGPLQLQGSNLSSRDVSGMTFPSTDLTGASLASAIVDDADLSKVVSIQSSNWEGVEWWRLKAISSESLAYLTKTFPFSPETEYATKSAIKPMSSTDVEVQTKRLASSSKK